MDANVTFKVNVQEAGVIAEALKAQRRSMAGFVRAVNATEQEKREALQIIGQCEMILRRMGYEPETIKQSTPTQ